MKHEQTPVIFDLQIPDTTEVERMVLADVVAAPDTYGDVAQLITDDFFTTPARVRLWALITDHYNRGAEISGMALTQEAGRDYFDEIMPKAAEAGMRSAIIEHAVMLRNGAAKRRAYVATAAFLSQSVAPAATEQDILAYAEAFAHAVEGPAPIRAERTLAEVLAEVRAEAVRNESAVKEGKSLRVTSGFVNIDEVLYGGFKSGQLVILAARPSVGKTAIMLQIAKSAASAGAPAMVFSLEMTTQELGERFLYSTGEVRPYQYTHGEIEWQAYDRGEGTLLPLPVYLNDFSRSLDQIVSRMTQAVKQGRCGIAFIDYLGIMADALNFGNAKLYQVIARITGTLKAVAKRLGIPIVLLCQLNRDQAREGRAPELFDLRDSGSIEQDADVVFMLDNHAPKEYATTRENLVFVWLRKNRSGKKDIGFVLEPNDTYSAFREVETILPTKDLPPDLPEPVTTREDERDEEPLPF